MKREIREAVNPRNDTARARPEKGHGRTPRPPEAGPSIERASAMLRALGDAERFRLGVLLIPAPLTVGEIAEATGSAMTTVSQRLKALHAAGLVRRRREARNVYYALADEHVVELIRSTLTHAGEGTRRPSAPGGRDRS